MDYTFLSVTFALIVFLFISYLLNVIKLSTPLLLIYLIFCFTYITDSDKTEYMKNGVVHNTENKNIKENSNNENFSEIKTKKIIKDDNQKLDISKPVVSFNPKPIIIDTNIIIKKDKEKSIDIESTTKEIITSSAEIDKENYSQTLKLNEIMICRGVYKRNPIKPGFTFTNNVDSLFCYTKISNKGMKQEIKHLWYYEDILITSVVYNIKTSYNYRSWSKKTILPKQTGQWRVDVVDSNEQILGTRNFQISSLNNAF